MKNRSRLRLVSASMVFGIVAALPPANAFAQSANPFAVTSIRTGTSSLPGTLAVRLSVYDSSSYELFWARVPNARTYRLEREGQTVQETDGVSRYVSGIDSSKALIYTLTARDQSDSVLATQRFTVQPSSNNPLVNADGGGAGSMKPSTPATAPVRTGSSSLGGNIPVRLSVYDGKSYELFWDRVAGAATYRLEREGQTVQTSDGVSRYVSGIDSAQSLTYTLTALDASGAVIRTTGFTVALQQGAQLAAAGSSSGPVTPSGSTSPTVGQIRTGDSDIGGDFPVRLSVYDASSYELTWGRIANAATYRLQRDGQNVQETDGLSRYVTDVDSAASFQYTLRALDQSGNAIRTVSFTVAPRQSPQLGAGASTTAGNQAPTDPSMSNGSIRTGHSTLTGPINIRLAVYDAKAYELFWDRVPEAVHYQLSRDGQEVQANDGASYFVASADSTQRFNYTLKAFSSRGVKLGTMNFIVAPRGYPQLLAGPGTQPTPVTPSGIPAPLDLAGQGIIAAMGGVQADRLSFVVRRVAAQVAATGTAMPLPATVLTTQPGFGGYGTLTTPTTRTTYTCIAGGHMTREVSRLREGPFPSYYRDHDVYVFDNCRVRDPNGFQGEGNYVFQGRLETDATSASGSRLFASSSSGTWTNFSLTALGSRRFEVAGTIATSSFNSDPTTSFSRTVDLSRYQQTIDDAVLESVQSSNVRQETSASPGGDSYTLTVAGKYQGSLSNGYQVDITTDPIFHRVRNTTNESANQPLSGQISLRSADGGELYLTAESESAVSNPTATSVFVKSSGESVSANGVIIRGFEDVSRSLSGCFLPDSERAAGVCGNPGDLP